MKRHDEDYVDYGQELQNLEDKFIRRLVRSRNHTLGTMLFLFMVMLLIIAWHIFG